MPSQPYSIQYAVEAIADLRRMRASDRRTVLDGIVRHLLHQPRMSGRSRIKAMTQPFWSQYRLRILNFRIYYDVDDGDSVVNVLRVILKTTNQTPGESP